MMTGSGEPSKSCSRYWRGRSRISPGRLGCDFFFAEFFAEKAFPAGYQEREGGCATGLRLSGGMNVGGAPRSSARRKFLARTSSPDCGGRMTRSPILRSPPQKLNQRHGKTREIRSKVTEVI